MLLSASQTPALQAPGKEFREAAAVAERSAVGDCQAGRVPVVCTHAVFLLPLPKDVGSLLDVCGAAVVRAVAGDWLLLRYTEARRSVAVTSASALLWCMRLPLLASPQQLSRSREVCREEGCRTQTRGIPWK